MFLEGSASNPLSQYPGVKLAQISDFVSNHSQLNANSALLKIDFQCGSVLPETLTSASLQEFYSNSWMKNILQKILYVIKILSMFDSTNLCEMIFSLIKLNTCKLRNQRTDEHLKPQ